MPRPRSTTLLTTTLVSLASFLFPPLHHPVPFLQLLLFSCVFAALQSLLTWLLSIATTLHSQARFPLSCRGPPPPAIPCDGPSSLGKHSHQRPLLLYQRLSVARRSLVVAIFPLAYYDRNHYIPNRITHNAWLAYDSQEPFALPAAAALRQPRYLTFPTASRNGSLQPCSTCAISATQCRRHGTR